MQNSNQTFVSGYNIVNSKMSCAQCVKLKKQIKVLQSDYEFQLKKNTEDNSTQKALYEINMQKQTRKWQDKYWQEKASHEQTTKLWLQKIDEVKESCSRSVSQLQLQHQQQLERQLKLIRDSWQKKYSELESSHRKYLEQLVSNHKHELVTLQVNLKIELQTLNASHIAQIGQTNQKWQRRQREMKNDYQSYIVGLRSQKNAQERERKKLQQQYSTQKMRLITEVYNLKQKISELDSSVSSLKSTIRQKENSIAQEQAKTSLLIRQQQQQLARQIDDYNRKLDEKQSAYQLKIKQFYQNELLITQKYQQSITRIQQSRSIQQRLYEHNLNEIKQCVENRPSRVQDVQEIIILKGQLSKSQHQYQLLARQIKNYQLQLQNKEDTFNKIFIPTLNSGLYSCDSNQLKRKDLKIKRPIGKSLSSAKEVLGTSSNNSNLPSLAGVDKKFLPPKSHKML